MIKLMSSVCFHAPQLSVSLLLIGHLGCLRVECKMLNALEVLFLCFPLFSFLWLMKFGESPFLTKQRHGGREHLSQEAIETTIDGFKLHNNFHIEENDGPVRTFGQ